MDDVKPSSPPHAATQLLDRARRLWRGVSANLPNLRLLPEEPAATDADGLRAAIQDCLAAKGGEVSARARAALLGETYLRLDPEGRTRFLRILADEFGPDRAQVDAAIVKLTAAADPKARISAERNLREALTAPRQRLLTQFTALPEGVKFLVDLRADIMARSGGDPPMGALDSDLRELLLRWFDIGLLELLRITWRSPAVVLERIAQRETVHAIRDWRDLKNRLDSDRRLYAFFHPNLPDEPLIFVEVALVKGLAGSVQALLDESAPLDDPARADTAIFYSINNAQPGLAGVNFGNFLIKRVANNLAAEFPNIRHFATLSPIPGFRHWLDARIEEGGVLRVSEEQDLIDALGAPVGRGSTALKHALDQNWLDKPDLADALRGPLMRLAARYLMTPVEGRPRAIDGVAHFHYSNGARFERLNWLADISDKGLAQSAGLMVNYAYRLDEIEANHEAYHGGKINASSAARALAKG